MKTKNAKTRKNSTPYDDELKKINRKLRYNKLANEDDFDKLVRKRNILNCKVEQFFVDLESDEAIKYKTIPNPRYND